MFEIIFWGVLPLLLLQSGELVLGADSVPQINSCKQIEDYCEKICGRGDELGSCDAATGQCYCFDPKGKETYFLTPFGLSLSDTSVRSICETIKGTSPCKIPVYSRPLFAVLCKSGRNYKNRFVCTIIEEGEYDDVKKYEEPANRTHQARCPSGYDSECYDYCKVGVGTPFCDTYGKERLCSCKKGKISQKVPTENSCDGFEVICHDVCKLGFTTCDAGLGECFCFDSTGKDISILKPAQASRCLESSRNSPCETPYPEVKPTTGGQAFKLNTVECKAANGRSICFVVSSKDYELVKSSLPKPGSFTKCHTDSSCFSICASSCNAKFGGCTKTKTCTSGGACICLAGIDTPKTNQKLCTPAKKGGTCDIARDGHPGPAYICNIETTRQCVIDTISNGGSTRDCDPLNTECTKFCNSASDGICSNKYCTCPKSGVDHLRFCSKQAEKSTDCAKMAGPISYICSPKPGEPNICVTRYSEGSGTYKQCTTKEFCDEICGVTDAECLANGVCKCKSNKLSCVSAYLNSVCVLNGGAFASYCRKPTDTVGERYCIVTMESLGGPFMKCPDRECCKKHCAEPKWRSVRREDGSCFCAKGVEKMNLKKITLALPEQPCYKALALAARQAIYTNGLVLCYTTNKIYGTTTVKCTSDEECRETICDDSARIKAGLKVFSKCEKTEGICECGLILKTKDCVFPPERKDEICNRNGFQCSFKGGSLCVYKFCLGIHNTEEPISCYSNTECCSKCCFENSCETGSKCGIDDKPPKPFHYLDFGHPPHPTGSG